MLIAKQKPVRSKKLRESARGVRCTLRLPGVCSHDPEKSVLAHPPVGNGGMSTKGDDSAGAVCCSDCHQVIDGHVRSSLSREEVYECWIRGHQETMAHWVSEGLVEVK